MDRAVKRQCRSCLKRKDVEVVHDAQHKTGGNWRRVQQTYNSSLCEECALFFESYLSSSDYGWSAQWSVSDIRRIATLARQRQQEVGDPLT